MTIPKFNETMYPLLDYIKDGEEYSVREISDDIRDKYFNLTEEEKKDIVSNGKTRFHDRLTWGRTYLKKAGLVIDPSRGLVRITSSGVQMIKEKEDVQKIELTDLEKFNSFLKFRKNKNLKEKNNVSVDDQNQTPQDMIDYGYNDILDSLKNELLEKLKGTNPYYFEKIILQLFQKMGYGDFEETKKSGDGGIDGIINQDALGIERIYTQAKRYTTSNVGEKDIRNFIGAMSGDVSKGIFVTTSNFDPAAHNKVRDARNHKIILINGERLVELMIKYNLGVQEKYRYEIKEVDEDYFLDD